MSDTVNLSLSEAEALVQAALTRVGASAVSAAATARALVRAEADGQTGHGLMRVVSYAGQVKTGKVAGAAMPHLSRPRPGVVHVDAGFGFAYPAIDMALEALVPTVKAQGVAAAAICRSHHFGQAGAHAERLANDGLVSLVFGNSPKAIAFWGARRPMMGTNPIAFAAPLSEGPPLVIDLALSRVARGKIVAAQKRGDSIPEGWAIDANGDPTTDPTAALGGSMVPIGEAKGAALALMVEVMSAALTASLFGWESSNMFRDDGHSPDLGQLLVAIDPHATSGGGFLSRMDELIRTVDAQDGARMPGQRRLSARAKAAREGLFIAPAIHAQIVALAND